MWAATYYLKRQKQIDIISRLENKASPVTHLLKSKGQPFSAGLKTKQAQLLTFWRAKDNHFQQAWKQSKPSHSPSGEPRTTIFSRLENKTSPVTHKLKNQGQPFSAGLKTKQAQSLTNWRAKDTFSAGLKIKQAQSLTSWRAKDNHFQQTWKQSKPSHSPAGEPRTAIFSRLENKASPVTHLLESQVQPFSAGFKTKQAQSLTNWRAKHNHFQQASKQSKPSHSPPGEPSTTIFSRLENKVSPITHWLKSQGHASSVTLALKCHERHQPPTY